MWTIKVDKISKSYRFNEGVPYSAREFFGQMFRRSRAAAEELWALRDISFELGEGETLGIIGNNGAGKSTLLKVLSRITKPTSGSAAIRGRIGSLLEVGTGFHNELSGRENIYLNGAILGMKRVEIAQKFDEIVAFSEIEKFLDTPVKHYSTGMYMRLAFAVAAHLEPEVLIVDEVLAVGDVGFQRKCLGKMRAVGESGKTVIFVSHDMQSITRLCSRVIWLREGHVVEDGKTSDVISSYLHEQSRVGAVREWGASDAPGSDVVRLRAVRVVGDGDKTTSSVDIRRELAIEMTYDVIAAGRIFVPSVQLYNDQGVCLFVSHDWRDGWRVRPRDVGTYTSRVTIPGNLLAEGTVFVTVGAETHQPHTTHFQVRDAVTFNVADSPEGDSARGDLAGMMPGAVRPLLEWETSFSG